MNDQSALMPVVVSLHKSHDIIWDIQVICSNMNFVVDNEAVMTFNLNALSPHDIRCCSA